jgi:hypothetical protein
MPRKKKPQVIDEATTEVSTAPKTLAERLIAAEKLVAKLKAEIANEAIKNDIQVDDVVTFSYGRGDKVREITGVVKATKDIEEGTLKGLNLLVLSGEGFDAQTYKVHVRDVVSNETADARRAAEATDEAPAETDPLEVA